MTEINKYHFAERRENFLKFKKRGIISDEDFKYRRTGRSLGNIFLQIGLAMTEPGRMIKITDHTGLRVMDRETFIRVKRLIGELELQNFIFNITNLGITYVLPHEDTGRRQND